MARINGKSVRYVYLCSMRWKTTGLSTALLVLAAAVRLPALTAGLPYISYVDEGHVLHHVVHLLAQRTWEPDTYSYGSFPFYLIAGAALAWSPVYAATHGHPLADDLSPAPPVYYDLLEPVDLLVLGRLVTLAFSLGVVILTGLLARRLAGPAAGLFAAWLAALVPALVARSTIVNINPLVAFFVLAALFFAEGTRDGDRPRRDAVLAGAMIGLATATKYPSALVCLPVALAIVFSIAPWRERFRRLLLAGGATLLTLVVAMPSLVLRTANVVKGIRGMSQAYGEQAAGTYWDQALRRAEWDLPLEHPEVGIAFLLLTGAGLAVALRHHGWIRSVLGWMLFAEATGLLVAPYKFRAFRNLLPLIPLACVVVALLYGAARRRLSRPLPLDVAAALLPVVLFTPALHQYVSYQLGLEDTRETTLRWLASHARPGDRVLFAEELTFLPSRLAAIPNPTVVWPWETAWGRIVKRRPHYLVLGQIQSPDGNPRLQPAVADWLLRNYRLAATFGSNPTPSSGYEHMGNQQVIYILRRAPPRMEPPPPRGAGRRSGRPRRDPAPSADPPGLPP